MRAIRFRDQLDGMTSGPTKLVFLLAAIAVAATAYAADILISDLSDIDFGQTAPTAGPLRSNLAICVSLDKTGPYTVIARGDGPGNRFSMSSGPYWLDYGVLFSDSRVPRGARTLEPGVPVTGLKGKKRKRGSPCRKMNASISVTLARADLEAAQAGSYRGTLTLTVIPE